MATMNLLLIGKTGNGKSATGNSILRRNVFRTLASTSSVTNEIQFNYSEYNGSVIKVVDTPGVWHRDLHESNQNLHSTVETVINQAVTVCPDGYNAIVYVAKFNGHFTIEDVEIVEQLRSIFGENLVKQMCTVVMTHGDNFYNEDIGSFEDWCSIQENDAFDTLRKYCNEVIILFDNKTKDKEKLVSQLNQLLKFAPPANKKPCISERKSRIPDIQLKMESKEPILHETLLQESCLIIQQLMMIDLSNPVTQRDRLSKLKDRAKKLLKIIKDQDNKNSGTLREYIGNAINILNSVEDQVLSAQDAEEIYKEQGDPKRSDKLGRGVNAKEKDEITLMEFRLKEDARKVEEENTDLVNEWWTKSRVLNAQSK